MRLMGFSAPSANLLFSALVALALAAACIYIYRERRYWEGRLRQWQTRLSARIDVPTHAPACCDTLISMRRRMRTIISLDDELHRRAKSYAAEHGTTLTALVEEALRARLAERRAKRRPPVRLPTFRGEGLQDGLSLDEMGAIYDRMDGLR